MTYRFLEDVSRADVAFEVDSVHLEKVFEEAGLALSETQVKDLKSVKHILSRKS